MADKVEIQVLTNEAIQTKISKGEALSDTEREFIKGHPNAEDGAPPTEKVSEEEELEDGDDDPAPDNKEAPPVTPAPPAAAKPGDKEAPAPKPTPAERQTLIAAELDKPPGQQDLSRFSEAEVGVYIDLRKQRVKNRLLQEELDTLKFEKVQKKLKPNEDPADPLEGIGEEDIITGKQLKEILSKTAKHPAKKEPAAGQITPEVVAAHETTADVALRAKGLTDYKEVSQWVQFALYDDPDAGALLKDAATRGENIAETAYWMVKGSKKWPQIKAAIDAEKTRVGKPPAAAKAEAPPAESADRAARFQKNTDKVRTTGSGGGGGDDVGEYTEQEVVAMSVSDFRKLPRDTRDKILKKFGSAPNMSRN